MLLTSRTDKKTAKNKIDSNQIKIQNLKNKSAFISKYHNKKMHKIQIKKIESYKLRRIHSAKKIEINKNMNVNINKYITKPKVNEIVKDLLSKNNKKYVSETVPKYLYSLKQYINPAKYADSLMKKEPNNESSYKSYRQQMKYIIKKNTRKYLIEGINDYHLNIKKYKEIYFESVFQKNNKSRKTYKRKINNSLNNEN